MSSELSVMRMQFPQKVKVTHGSRCRRGHCRSFQNTLYLREEMCSSLECNLLGCQIRMLSKAFASSNQMIFKLAKHIPMLQNLFQQRICRVTERWGVFVSANSGQSRLEFAQKFARWFGTEITKWERLSVTILQFCSCQIRCLHFVCAQRRTNLYCWAHCLR